MNKPTIVEMSNQSLKLRHFLILQMHGYKTGLYTSPHLVDFRERIRINGNMIPEQAVIDFVETIKDQIEIIQPSFFEITPKLPINSF